MLGVKGQDLSRTALEALAIDAYRMDRITAYQLSQALGIPSRDALNALLKRHGVPLEYTREDCAREGEVRARLWQQRQDAQAADRDGPPRAE